MWDYKENGLTFPQGFDVLVKLSAFTSGKVKCVGIISDAETDADAVEKSIRQNLSKHSLPVPSKSMELAEGNKKASTAYLVIPHGKKTGCLDTALLSACIAEKEHIELAEEYVAKISAIQPKVNSNIMDKRRVRSLIAGSGDQPYRTVSHCVGSLWSFDKPSLKVVIDFIELLRDGGNRK